MITMGTFQLLSSIVSGGLTPFSFIKYSLMLFGLLTIIVLLIRWMLRGSEPILMMLNCDRQSARTILMIMRRKGISFSEFHALTCAAIGYFLPLYGRVVDDRPVADSGETKKAIVFAMKRGSIRAGMKRDEFIQVIAKELAHFRSDESPLTDPTRQVDGIMF